MIDVVLVDDQPVLRAGLARILSPADGFRVVCECGDGREVVEALAAHPADLVVMDVRMPEVDGIEATRSVLDLADPPPVLALTTFDEDEVLWGMLDAGAAGFVLKDADAEELLAAARTVAGGGSWFDPAVTPRVLGAYRTHVAAGRREAARLEQLTDREHEVLELMARGAVNSEIAAKLFVSEATVKSHVGAIFGKLDVRDRAAAIIYAFDHAVVDPDRGR